jgi:hypothetical protein
MPTLAALAEELAVDPADIEVLVRGLTTKPAGDPSAQLASNVAASIRAQLDPNGERTRFDLYCPQAENT